MKDEIKRRLYYAVEGLKSARNLLKAATDY